MSTSLSIPPIFLVPSPYLFNTPRHCSICLTPTSSMSRHLRFVSQTLTPHRPQISLERHSSTQRDGLCGQRPATHTQPATLRLASALCHPAGECLCTQAAPATAQVSSAATRATCTLTRHSRSTDNNVADSRSETPRREVVSESSTHDATTASYRWPRFEPKPTKSSASPPLLFVDYRAHPRSLATVTTGDVEVSGYS